MVMKQYEILIPGYYFCDVVFTGIPEFPSLGTEIYTRDLQVVPGGVMNTVVAMRRLGAEVGWCSALGTDFFSEYIREQVEREGLDTALLSALDVAFKRVTVALSFPSDRAFVTYVDPAPDLILLLQQALEGVQVRHLHFPGLIVDARLPDLLRQCREAGIVCSMDCQHREETLAIPLVEQTLSELTWFMPNASEAQRITGTDSIPLAAERLREVVPNILIKDGAQGAYAWHANEAYHAPALSFEVLDTTGAGDVFNAGFLTALLRGLDIQTCLRWGNIAGGLSTQGIGGCSNAPTLSTLETYLDTAG